MGEGRGEGLKVARPNYASLPQPFSQREKGDLGLKIAVRTPALSKAATIRRTPNHFTGS
jgi:hypothetical protein